MMDGIQVQWLLDRSVLDMADEMRRHVRSLARIEV
jgi:hypothetical protein